MRRENRYNTSSGEKLTTLQIENRIKKAKAAYLERFRDNQDHFFCERCGKSTSSRFDLSHIISVADAKASGQSELCYDVFNLELLCRPCHTEIESRASKGRREWYKQRLINAGVDPKTKEPIQTMRIQLQLANEDEVELINPTAQTYVICRISLIASSMKKSQLYTTIKALTKSSKLSLKAGLITEPIDIPIDEVTEAMKYKRKSIPYCYKCNKYHYHK